MCLRKYRDMYGDQISFIGRYTNDVQLQRADHFIHIPCACGGSAHPHIRSACGKESDGFGEIGLELVYFCCTVFMARIR